MVHVRRAIDRPPVELVETFSELPASTVAAVSRLGAVLDPAIRPLYPGLTLSGPALTVSCVVGDNLMLHKALEVAEAGDVIVGSVGNYRGAAYWGELMTIAAQAKKLGGLVIDGAVRDGLAIRALGFPIFTLGLCMRSTAKESLGQINFPITCGSVTIEPGDIVCGDDDGVVIVPQKMARQILEKAQQRQKREERIKEELRRGRTILEVQGREELLVQKGLVEERNARCSQRADRRYGD